MAGFTASAPGKLVIAGEYAVLEGGPAIATAVNCRAVADLETGTERNELCIANSRDCFAFDFTDDGLRWHDNPGEQGDLLVAAAKVLGSALHNLEPFSVNLCTRKFYVDGIKQGLGSSAALAVALSGCLQQALGRQTKIETALAVHREFQQGSGSGIDVHTSFHGGTVALVDDAAQPCVWPEGISLLPVWTGVAASTPGKLKQLAKFAESQPQVYGQLQSELAGLSAGVLQACAAGDGVALLAALTEFATGLRAFDKATELGIWSSEHNELADMAAGADVVYKPSGAGGGDYGLAFSSDDSSLQRFRQAVESSGYACGDFEVGANGLTVA